MKKILTIIIIEIVISFPLYSQLYNFYNDNNVDYLQGKIIIETDSSYIGINKSFLDSIQGGAVSFTEYSKKDGSVKFISAPFYNDSTANYELTSTSFSHIRNNKIYTFANAIFYDEKLISYDLNSKETKIEFTMKDDSNYYNTFLNDAIFYNNKYYRSGSSQNKLKTDIYAPVLSIIDTNGVMEHFLYEYDVKNYYNLSGSIAIIDSSIIYVATIDNKTTREDQIRIMEIDLEGKLKKEKILPQNLILNLPKRVVSVNKDSILFTCWKGKKGSEPTIPITYIYQPVVILYSLKEDKILKIQNFGVNDFNSIDSYPCLIKASDGNFIYAGTEIFNYNKGTDSARVEQKGVIGKVDKNNNPVWRKYYTLHKPSFEKLGSIHEISDIENTSDGNYIAYGQVRGWTNNEIEHHNDAWLFKVDEDGELVMVDTTNSSHDFIDEDFPIKIYPNPTSDVLYINQEEIENIKYSIIDMSGKVLFKFSITERNNMVSVDIKDLETGIYFLKVVKDEKKSVFKFIKK